MADAVDVEITGDSGPLVEALQAAAEAAAQLAEIIRQLRDDIVEADGAMDDMGAAADVVDGALASVDATGTAATAMLRDLASQERDAAAGAQELGDSAAASAAGIEAEGAAAVQAAAEISALRKEEEDLAASGALSTGLADAFAQEQDLIAEARAAQQDLEAARQARGAYASFPAGTSLEDRFRSETQGVLSEAERLGEDINQEIANGAQRRSGSLHQVLNAMLSELGDASPGQVFGITRLENGNFSQPAEMAFEQYVSTIRKDAAAAGRDVADALNPSTLFAQAQNDLQRSILSAGSALTDYEAKLASWRGILEEVAPELEDVAAGADKYASAFDGTVGPTQSATDAVMAFRQAFAEMEAAQAAATAAGQAFDAAVVEQGLASEVTAEALARLRDAEAEEAAATAAAIAANEAMDAALLEGDAAIAIAAHEVRSLRDAEMEAAAGAAFLGGALAGWMSVLDVKGLMSKLSGVTNAIGGGVNKVATFIQGLLNPMAIGIGALVPLVASLIPVIVSLGGGIVAFGALAAPALFKVVKGFSAVHQAQATYQQALKAYQLAPTKANLQTAQRDLVQLRAAYANLPPPVRGAVRAIQGFMSAWSQASKKAGIQHDALMGITRAITDAKDALPEMARSARAFAPILKRLLGDIGQNLKSGPFHGFVTDINKEMPKAASAVHAAAGALGEFFSQIMKPSAAAAGSNVLKQVSAFFRQINPNIVHGLTGAEHVLGSLFKEMTALSKSDVGHTIGRVWDDFWHGAKNGLNWARDAIRTGGNLWKAILGGVGIGNGASAGWRSFLEPWRTFKPKPPPNLLGPDRQEIAAAKAHATQGGEQVGQATANGVTKGMNQAGKAAAKSTSQLANEAVRGIQGIKGKLSSAVAKSMAQDISQGMSQAKSQISQTIGRTIQTALTSARTQATSGWNAIQTAFTQGAARAVQAVQPMVGRIMAALSPLPGRMNSIGLAAANGLAAGIIAGTGAAVAAAAAMAAAVTKAAQVHLQTHSPSVVFYKIGRNTVQGFVNGLLGGRSAVQAAMALIFGVHPHNSTIQKWINKLRQEVRAAFTAGVIGSREDSRYTRLIREDNKRLQKLASERKRIENEIKAADALARSVQSGAETGANVVSSYGMTFAGLNATQRSYPTIRKAMEANLHNIRQFRADIMRLKKEGLSKQIIRQLLGAGVSGGLPIAEELLKTGNIRGYDKLQKEIDKASRALGITGANAAYESGREIGKGLAAGLKSQLKGIEDAMRRIARELIRAIRRALRIKSPSEATREIGVLTGLGLAQGIDASTAMVRAAARRMSGSAAQAFVAPARSSQAAAAAGPVVHNHITLQVDGKTLARTVQVHSLRHAHRNPATGLKLAGRGI